MTPYSMITRINSGGRLSVHGTLTAAHTTYQHSMKRTYSTQQSKEGGPNILLFVGLTALGGAGHHYYKKNPHVFGADKKDDNASLDYEQANKDVTNPSEKND